MYRTLSFGKYKGQDIKYIILTHIGYIMWCLENISQFNLNEEEQNIYDAVALLIKKDKLKTKFPVELLYKHIKNPDLDTPFYMDDGYISFSMSSNNPICNSVAKYATIKKDRFYDSLSAISHSVYKESIYEIEFRNPDKFNEDEIFGGWQPDDA